MILIVFRAARGVARMALDVLELAAFARRAYQQAQHLEQVRRARDS